MTAVSSMSDKLILILPEMWLFLGAVAASVMGLSRSRAVRDSVPLLVCLFLATALVGVPIVYADPGRLIRAGLLVTWP